MLSSIDYQRLKERYTRNIHGYWRIALVVMMVYNVSHDLIPLRLDLRYCSSLLYSYGFRATVNGSWVGGYTPAYLR